MMTRKKGIIVAVLVALLVVALPLGVGLYIRSQRPPVGDVWAGPELTVSERMFMFAKTGRLIDNWYEGGRRRARGYDDGVAVYLTIDTDTNAVWLEADGQTIEGQEFELPGKLAWSAYHFYPEGYKELKGRTYFKALGRKAMPEVIYLAGQESQGRYVHVEFSGNTNGWGNSSGTFDAERYLGAIKGGFDKDSTSAESIVVTKEEYEKELAGKADAGKAPKELRLRWDEKSLGEWLKVEEAFYRSVETEAVKRGQTLETLSLEVGPDGLGGHAVAIATRTPTLFLRIFGGSPRVDLGYTFRHVGDGVWHVKVAVSGYSRFGRDSEYEYLVSASSEMPGKRKEYMKRGREIKDVGGPVNPAWSLELDSGGDIEILGVCEYPCTGKAWWGPDGSALEYVPCAVDNLSEDMAPKGRAYIFAMKVDMGKAKRFHEEGWFNAVRATDIYGREMAGVKAYIFAWDRPETSVDVTFGFSDEAGKREDVDFENISLVPGVNAGFEIAHRRSGE